MKRLLAATLRVSRGGAGVSHLDDSLLSVPFPLLSQRNMYRRCEQYRMHEEHRRCVRCNSGGGDGGGGGAPRPVRRPADLDTDIERVRERERARLGGGRERGGGGGRQNLRARAYTSATRERFMGETPGTTRTSSRDPPRRAALRRRRRCRYSGDERERESPT